MAKLRTKVNGFKKNCEDTRKETNNDKSAYRGYQKMNALFARIGVRVI